MRAALSLELELFRHQKAQISRALSPPSRAFRAYEDRYRRRTRTAGTPLSPPEVHAAVLGSDVIYVGDYHTLRQAQQSYLELVETARSDAARRRVVMALEFVEGRHQAKVDAFLARRLSEEGLRKALGHPNGGEFDLWQGFRPLFLHARAQRIQILGIDSRASGPHSLHTRDVYAAQRISRALQAEDRPRVVALVGQYHVAPCHLPARVQEQLGGSDLHGLVVYQNCEGVYWALARQGRLGQTSAVMLRERELCLLNASPVLCQQSYLDYLEAEAGDAPLPDRAATERFRELATLIARFLGVDVRKALGDVEVATAANLSFLDRLRARGGLSPRELASVRKQVLSRESYYVPRAKVAYLASLSLNHAAEEAAHFVRHCCIGQAMDAPRRAEDAFYARCLEEALGFLGSRLVNPQRHCQLLPAWAETFRTQRGEARRVAAFVLAHKAAEAQGTPDARNILPLRPPQLFHAVSHALGYLLGDALHRAFMAGHLKPSQLRALFRDPFPNPAAQYFAWVREVRNLAPLPDA